MGDRQHESENPGGSACVAKIAGKIFSQSPESGPAFYKPGIAGIAPASGAEVGAEGGRPRPGAPPVVSTGLLGFVSSTGIDVAAGFSFFGTKWLRRGEYMSL